MLLVVPMPSLRLTVTHILKLLPAGRMRMGIPKTTILQTQGYGWQRIAIIRTLFGGLPNRKLRLRDKLTPKFPMINCQVTVDVLALVQGLITDPVLNVWAA